jgi:hypothetical protein
MKQHPDETEEAREVRFWTHDEARKAVPYLRSVLHSVREHYLEMEAQQGRARKLAGQAGRPDRSTLIAHGEMLRRADEAHSRFLDAVDELEEIDVFCCDPVRGEAIIPFLHGDQPAWFIFDLFAHEPLTDWRYHSDSVEIYRPLQEMLSSVA